MRDRTRKRASLPDVSFLPRLLLVAIGLLSTLQARGETTATNPSEEARWQAETVFQFAARTDYASTQGHVRRRDAMVGAAQLRFASPERPIVAGLMIEYRFVDDKADTLRVAGMFSYKMRKWTASASPFYQRTAQRAAGDWHYWSSFRRHIAGRHSLGVELFGALDTGRPTKWMLGYDGAITETLSVGVAAGAGFNGGPDWVARTSLTWRPRPGRR